MHVRVVIALAVTDAVLGTLVGDDMGVLALTYILATTIWSVALGVRRLHDAGYSGWWQPIILVVPVVGALVLLVFSVLDSEPGPSRYGASPKSEVASQAALARPHRRPLARRCHERRRCTDCIHRLARGKRGRRSGVRRRGGQLEWRRLPRRMPPDRRAFAGATATVPHRP